MKELEACQGVKEQGLTTRGATEPPTPPPSPKVPVGFGASRWWHPLVAPGGPVVRSGLVLDQRERSWGHPSVLPRGD